MSKTLSIILTEKQHSLLTAIAKKQDRSISYIIRQLIDDNITDYIKNNKLVDFSDIIKKYDLQ